MGLLHLFWRVWKQENMIIFDNETLDIKKTSLVFPGYGWERQWDLSKYTSTIHGLVGSLRGRNDTSPLLDHFVFCSDYTSGSKIGNTLGKFYGYQLKKDKSDIPSN